MAKISARGDREAARWRRASDGAELVLTQRGRLLWKWRAGATYALVPGGNRTREQAEEHAHARGLEAVS